MKNRMTGWRSRVMNAMAVLAMLVAAMMLVGPMGVAQADGGSNPRVFAPNSEPYGKTYGEWTAKWWQWALSMPTTRSPLVDTADCSREQRGKVWFLAGSADGTPKERNCTVPSDTALFFALINVECSDVEPPPFFGATPRERRACAKPFVDGTGLNTLKVTLDGEPVRNLEDFRFVSPDFRFTMPAENNLFGVTSGATGGHATSDGYWLMLKPLSRGRHVLHIEAAYVSGPGAGFTQNVTYNLRVRGEDD